MSAPVPDDYMIVSKQFDHTVPTYAALVENVGRRLYANGDRILVERDENADQFWTLWAYRPLATEANENGLYFEAMQTYRTTDFWEVIDWYAEGYGPLDAPRTAYASATVRDLYENPTPKNRFVRIEDDGTTGWSWTAYDGTGWSVVAREKATVRLSDAFFDITRPVFGEVVQTLSDFADIPTRDGSWELRELFNALRFKVLDKAEMNELFFSMLSFYHAQQDQVDWAFKTSFLSVLGYNERLTQSPIASYDNTENLLDYLEEVKPYHVKIRDFSRMLTPDVDVAAVHATDFDKPLVYDETLAAYRRLDPANADDMTFMRTTSPWSDWQAQHGKTEYDPDRAGFNPIRNIALTLRFDRYDAGDLPLESGFGWDLAPWDLLGWDGEQSDIDDGRNALSRLIAYYHPTLGMIEASPDELLSGYAYRGIVLDGGDLFVPRSNSLSEWDIRGFDTMPIESSLPVEQDVKIGSLLSVSPEVLINPTASDVSLRDPHHLPGHPEELVPVVTNSALTLTVQTGWTKGAPHQSVTTIEPRRTRKTTIDLSYAVVASSHDAILVYRDGLRAIADDDYTVDYTSKTVRVVLGTPRAKRVTLHVFGVAGRDTVSDVIEYQGNGARTAFAFDEEVGGTVELYVDGRAQPFTRSGRVVHAASPPAANSNVVLVGYVVPTHPTRVHHEVLPPNTAQQWTLAAASGSEQPLGHVGRIVTTNGRTLTPPFTRMGDFHAGNRLVGFRPLVSTDSLSIWIDGQPYRGAIGHVAEPGYAPTPDRDGAGWDVRPWDVDLYDVAGDIVLWRDHLWLNTPSLVGPSRPNRVLAVAEEGHDYTVSGQTLTIVTPLAPSDYDGVGWDVAGSETPQPVPPQTRIVATTFTNADTMGASTHSFQGSPAGLYRVPLRAPSHDYLIVSIDGLTLTPGIDYTLAPETIGWDEGSYDHVGLGLSDDAVHQIVTIPGGQEPWQSVVLTAFEAAPARQSNIYGMITAKASASIMGDDVFVPDWGFAPFDRYPLGSTVTRVEAVHPESPLDVRPIKRMNDGWQVFGWNRATRITLAEALIDTSTEVVIALVDTDNPEIVSPNPFAPPDLENAVPGAIMIAGERIEYFLMEQVGTTVRLRQLRRGTRATRIGQEQRRRAIVPADGATTRFLLPGATLEESLKSHPIEVTLLGTDDRRFKQLLSTNYTLDAHPGGVLVVFAQAPGAGVRVCLGQSHGNLHPVGTPVRNVSSQQRDVFGPFRIRDIPPMVDTDPSVRTYMA